MPDLTRMFRLIPCIYLRDGKAVDGLAGETLFAETDPVKLAAFYSENDADELMVFDLSNTPEEHEAAIACLRQICEKSKCPVIAAGSVNRMEDVKKYLYAGAGRVLLNFSRQSNVELLEEVSKRFGKEKLLASIADAAEYLENRRQIALYASGIVCLEARGSGKEGGAVAMARDLGILAEVPIILHTIQTDETALTELLKAGNLDGLAGTLVSSLTKPVRAIRKECLDQGLSVYRLQSSLSWKDFKLNSDGLIPVVVQDFRTEEVLMVAYMNEEAFTETLHTGKMTYYSRSRQELWVKGLTSGHYQYVKSLTIDCDYDTILAKVDQTGAACHTGNRSCFFTPLAARDFDDTNPLHVFQSVYDVIEDRKIHPKEGSYTNYLFDKGLDKILKKVGEECTEVVIAAKNTESEEVTYEISDLMYHLMVLMAEKGITWEEVTRELARR